MPSIGQFSALKLPASNLPAVTYGMLVDFLGKDRIVSAPAQTKRVFRWLKIHGREGFEPSSDIRLGQLLNVCQSEHAQTVLEENPEAFVCATLRDRTPPEWAATYKDRLVLVEQHDAFLYFCFLIMKLFTDSLLFCTQLDNIARNSTNLQEGMGIAASAINARLSCFDMSGALIAQAEPSRCEREAKTREEKLHKIQRKVVLEGTPFAILQVESKSDLSTGQKDLLEIAKTHLEPIFKKSWDKQSHLICPHWHLLTSLIEEKDGAQKTEVANKVQDLLRKTASATQFKLLLLSLSKANTSATALASHAQLINNGKCLVFAYKKDLCILCFAEEGDSLLSHKKTQEDVAKHLSKFPEIEATSSQIFENMNDLDLAYQQASMTRNFLPLVNKEPQSTSETLIQPSVTPFEVCLAYYLMSCNERSERLLSFTFSHTLMQKLNEEDQANGTNHLDVFWQYLICERNATMVAERLHMHRNTVIYRMERIQKRFDLDLADPNAREKMILDFKMFFFMNNRTKP